MGVRKLRVGIRVRGATNHSRSVKRYTCRQLLTEKTPGAPAMVVCGHPTPILEVM